MNGQRVAAVALSLTLWSASPSAHSGPPFPIVPTRVVGPYELSVYADPDTTDDQSTGGQFWVTIHTAARNAVPADTRARVSIVSADGRGPIESGTTKLESGEVSRQFVALVMDHEGPYHVTVEVDGDLGHAEVTADVDATYDLRPPRALMIVYVAPFVLVGFLWIKLLLRRRKR